ncbi:REP-associated tyrosine transposase [Cerasicoccus fimbriatus]|uniref:REP-associated tyrosine transposase n=1 Tax=Cerasicoccus fimbriatus TaxID=3014554 RepID=UPI0022B40407|nr:transposase [Cerasicoccus sp. TK19100]
MAEPLPDRKRPARQPIYDQFNRANIIFLTVCTAQRKPILANHAAHERLRQCWQEADHWRVGRYVIMPDHIHLFCSPARVDHLPLKKWVAYWKSTASRQWPAKEDQPIWQMDGWDRQLRSGESYSAKWLYVRNNPVRHGLVDSPENWPFQGELNVLFWHD